MKALKTKLLTIAAGTAAVAAISGCDLQENADIENGRQAFTAQCGTCHQLTEAATTATVGPDLDASFAAARDVGMDSDTIEGVVEAQIQFPRTVSGPNPEADPTYMPADLVEGEDLRDVAYYVAQVAGVPGIEPPNAPGGPGGQVFANNGCGSCHIFTPAGSQGVVGPNLDEALQGQTPAEVAQSIVDPDAELSPGFDGGIMPANYGDSISPEDLELLVDFLLNGDASSGGGSSGGGGGSSGGGSSGGGNSSK